MPKFGCHDHATLRGGVHPDYIQSVSRDMVPDSTAKTSSYFLTFEPCHIISAHVALISNNVSSTGSISVNTSYYSRERYESLTVSLFTTNEWSSAHRTYGGFRTEADDDADKLDNRSYISTCALTASTQTTWTSPPEMYGIFCDGGLYVEAISPIADDQGGRIVVNYVPRSAFPPAYADPIEHLQHYWRCKRDTPFLDGFFGGTRLNYDDTVSTADPTVPNESTPPNITEGTWEDNASFGSSGFHSTGSYPI